MNGGRSQSWLALLSGWLANTGLPTMMIGQSWPPFYHDISQSWPPITIIRQSRTYYHGDWPIMAIRRHHGYPILFPPAQHSQPQNVISIMVSKSCHPFIVSQSYVVKPWLSNHRAALLLSVNASSHGKPAIFTMSNHERLKRCCWPTRWAIMASYFYMMYHVQQSWAANLPLSDDTFTTRVRVSCISIQIETPFT